MVTTQLDATCGYKAMWRNKDTSDVIFLDLRRECNPTVIGDARYLPFRDQAFDVIYCDPPHLIRSDALSIITHQPESAGAKYLLRYGWFKSRSEWIGFLYRVNIEFRRCLKDNGRLWFKLIDGKDPRVTKLRDIELYLTNFRIVEKQIEKARLPWSSNKTVYLWMVKK